MASIGPQHVVLLGRTRIPPKASAEPLSITTAIAASGIDPKISSSAILTNFKVSWPESFHLPRFVVIVLPAAEIAFPFVVLGEILYHHRVVFGIAAFSFHS
jgi:hypothetical protein